MKDRCPSLTLLLMRVGIRESSCLRILTGRQVVKNSTGGRSRRATQLTLSRDHELWHRAPRGSIDLTTSRVGSDVSQDQVDLIAGITDNQLKLIGDVSRTSCLHSQTPRTNYRIDQGPLQRTSGT